MPRTTTLETRGCPPIRALTFDNLGLIKVVEARQKEGGVPKVVQRWGEPDASKAVLTASLVDRQNDPLLAVARQNNSVEILNPLNGDLHASISNFGDSGTQADASDIVGLHLFKGQKFESASRSCTLLTCTTKGNANINSFRVGQLPEDSILSGSSKAWSVCGSGSIEFSKVDGSEAYALFGGKGVEVNVWDLDKCDKIWTAKPPPKNSLGIFTPTWFTSATFLSEDDHRKLVAGTNNHQVRLYDISAQRRPVISFNFRETPIKAVAEDIDGQTIYVGNGSGDLASFDIRTGKLLGNFKGKCAGSIRSVARHPELPVLASCGLDSYLRLWDIKTRQLLAAVFLKQHLTNLVLDSHFEDEDVANPSEGQQLDDVNEIQNEDNLEKLPAKRKKESKKNKEKSKRSSSDSTESKKSKSKKKGRRLKSENFEDA